MNTPETREIRPAPKKSKKDMIILSLKTLLRFKRILMNVTTPKIKRRKSSHLTETYVPGILIKGNFG
jgi:hypothetical protein